MIGMIKRILDVSGNYKGRIYGAMVLSFLKGMLMKVPAVAVFLIVSAFSDGELTKTAGIYAAIALVGSVAVQAIFQNIADRLQSAAGYIPGWLRQHRRDLYRRDRCDYLRRGFHLGVGGSTKAL